MLCSECKRNIRRVGRVYRLLKCHGSTPRCFSTAQNNGSLLQTLRQQNEKDIIALPEYKARSTLDNFLRSKVGLEPSQSSFVLPDVLPPTPPTAGYTHVLNSSQIALALDAAIATFHLHVESRIASLCGQGFYTIGPCGEEMLSSIGFALDPHVDAMALHYRHLSASIVRQLRLGRKSLEDIILDRARGYCVSRLDPVTGGVHCAIGSARESNSNDYGGGDYVVTSTLASQCPPAVGRALAFPIADSIIRDNNCGSSASVKQVSFVTVGDGSVHNAHFLSAFNLARHARFRRIKCPVVFGVSDNGLSISYPTDFYAHFLFSEISSDPKSRMQRDRDGVLIFKANGCDMFDVYDKTLQATSYSRKNSAPSLVLYQELIRRFGHAATDRQHAYLDADTVDRMADSDVVASGIVQAVEQWNALTYNEVYDRFHEIGVMVKRSFDMAAEEPKIATREEMIEQVSQPMVQVPQLIPELLTSLNEPELTECIDRNKAPKRDVMRKHMTRVVSEALANDAKVVYIGEDVEHGGYYLVTDGLAKRFPGRVIDFPPDETTLLGAAMGFSQAGLLPIVEIPYSKYLDCGADMFYELSINNWLTNKQRPNGMIVRIQGFDKGLFGGNFHTHNMIPHIPPGVDILCYSNGKDYVRGFRNAIIQARNGRVVVLIDSTHLLNLRHLHGKDRGWESSYPADENEIMSFHDVRRFGGGGKHLIVTYGNGVVTSLRARRSMAEQNIIISEEEVDIVDCPYISDIPDGLRALFSSCQYKVGSILFCDVCKEGPGSNVLSSMIMGLKKNNLLPSKWGFVAAPRTYNPLGSTVTFLNEDDIIGSFLHVNKLAGDDCVDGLK